jgi:hypothetical protein
MRAEVIIEDKNDPLWRYSYDKAIYPKTAEVELDMEVVSASVDGDSGVVRVKYLRYYLDSSGKTIRMDSSSSTDPAIWTIEKKNEKWFVVKIYETP